MKKIIATVAFFALTIGVSNTVVAQSFNAKRAQEVSMEFAKQNAEKLNLSEKQLTALYNAKLLQMRQTASSKTPEAKKQINETFTAKIEAALKPSQYKKYLALKK